MYALINIGMSILIGIIFILAAIILQKNPPTDINAAYGYRTKRSMKNKKLYLQSMNYFNLNKYNNINFIHN